MKNRKTFTFMVASNQKGKTRRILVPASLLYTMAFALVVLVVIVSATLVDYSGLLIQSNENKRLRAENTQLKSQFELVEGKLQSLESGLSRLKRFSTKLKVITEAFGVNDRELHLAMGPLVETSKNLQALEEKIEERGPSAVVAGEDATFFRRPLLDPAKGEVSVKGLRDYASLSIRIDQSLKGVSLQEQGVIELWAKMSEKESLIRATPMIRPVRGWITSKFGFRIHPVLGKAVMHNGLDLAAKPGTEVRAPADGVVSFSGTDSSYGKLISIDHGYGYTTRYGHNSKLFVSVGQKVKRGQVISLTGNTGRTTGPHLHYEVRVSGLAIDPRRFILD